MHLGHYSWGVIFDGSSRAKIRFGCVAFAAGAKGDHPRLQWGIHHPAAWVIVAEYIHPALKMDAVMIAPPSEADVIFRVMNKAVFTSRGWIFVKRG